MKPLALRRQRSKTRLKAELEPPQVSSVRVGDFTTPPSLCARIGPVPQLCVRWNGLLQRLQAGFHGEEEESWAERETLLDIHRAWHFHVLVIQVLGYLEVHLYALGDVDMAGRQAHLCEHRPEHILRY